MMDLEAAKAFGRKRVKVELLHSGDNVKFQPETTTVIRKNTLAPAQKKDAAAIPGNKVPASKVAVKEAGLSRPKKKLPPPWTTVITFPVAGFWTGNRSSS